ncbi:MAG: DMT family transporter [Flavobacteriales bacterium]|nr:DMT family transporter [Flavobacteriales bacterium]
MKQKKYIVWAHLALFVVNLIYGLNFVIAKDVMPLYIKPGGFILLRVIGANILFWTLHAFYSSFKILREDWWRFVAGGFFGVAANQILFFKGLNLTTPINASIIMVATPIIVLLFGALAATERITMGKGLGIMLGATGAVLLILNRTIPSSFAANPPLGNLFVLLNAASYAIYMIIAKPLMKKYQPLFVIKWVFLFGLIFVIPFGWKEFASIQWHSFPPDVIWKTIYIVVGVTFVTYLFNMFALKHLHASIVSIYIYVQPVIAALHAISLGKDQLTFIMIGSSALIFGGVFLVSRNKN